jgi:hypothetical protein
MKIEIVTNKRHVEAYAKALKKEDYKIADKIYRGLVAIEGYEYAITVRWEAMKLNLEAA